MGWFEDFSVKVVLKPIGEALAEGANHLTEILTATMPEIGAGVMLICGVMIMITGDVPKWLGRMAVGVGGAIIWLLNA